MSFSTKVLVGLVSGLAAGLFLGELVAPMRMFADGFIKLLQMTVLPYVTISIISSLGSLDAAEAKRLGLRVGAVLAGLWVVALGFAMLFPLAFPEQVNASFFSTALVEKRQPFNFVDLFIPSNPFHSLANGVVPAVVLFAVVLGIAMIGLDRKQVLLDVLSAASALVSRATRFVVQLTPYGMFAIAANAAGTMQVEQLEQVQVYLLTYVAIALLVSLWVLPGLVSALTPIGYREVLGRTRAALLTAFMAGDLFIVLPMLIEACADLLARHDLTDQHTRELPHVIVPASFNFPHTGKLLSVSFILFAGWFADVSVRLEEYPRLALTGLLTFFGSLNAAVPFLLDLFRIPADTFQLYLATGVVNARFGALLAALHTVAVALLGSAAVTGRLRVDVGRLLRFAVVTTLLTAATIGGLRVLFASVLKQEFEGARVVYGMRPVFEPIEARVLPGIPETDVAPGPGAHTDAIRRRGALRVCVLPDRMPYAYADAQGRLKGFDVEMAHRLGHDLGVRLEFVQTTLEELPAVLERGGCDLAMSGTPVTPLRASAMLFSQPYLDETLGWIVKDHLRDQFSSWEAIRALGPVRVGAPDLPYYVQEVRDRAPALRIEVVAASNAMEEFGKFDAFLLPAERGSVLTLLHPELSVVVPQPDPIRVPLAYPLFRHGDRWEAFMNTWIELKRRDGTIDRLYRRWILGQDAVKPQPRWSIVRSVLHWVE
jgi:Na+/H+-dicarboxylate symporter/ABC-type amino acid transport substrate-binding protein